MTVTALMARYLQTANMIIPPEGPVIVPTEFDFSAEPQIIVESEALFQSGKISIIQGVYVDNLANPNPLELFNQISRQTVTVPANSQGYFNIFFPKPSTILASTTPVADLVVKAIFYNVPIESGVWPAGSGGTSDGLTDAQLRASPVEVTETTTAPTYVEYNIVMDGTNETLAVGTDFARKLIIQNPTGNNTVSVNLAGGDSTVGGLELLAGQTLILDGGISNDFTYSGTNGETIHIEGGA